SQTLSATAFRPVNYQFFADGNMITTSGTSINAGALGNPPNPQFDSGLGSRNPAQGNWEKCSSDTIHFEQRLELYSSGKGRTGNAGGKQAAKADAILLHGADPTFGDVLQVHTDFYTTRYKFSCLDPSNNNTAVPGEYCTVAEPGSISQVKCTGNHTCSYSGEIQGEEVFQSGTADTDCVRLATAIDASFDSLPK